MNLQATQRRQEKVREAMEREGLSALIITHPANRFYVSAFELHNPQDNESCGLIVLMADGKHWLCTDPRFLDAAKALWPHERIFIYGRNAAEDIATLIEKHNPNQGKIGFEALSMKAGFYLKLSEKLTLFPADNVLSDCRSIKDADEIAAMRKACQLNHELMRYLPTTFKEGQSEEEIAWTIETFFRTNGASELAFPSIVAINNNAAMPHAIPSSTTLLTKNCHVLVDVGCRVDEYCSDQTRTFWFGDTPEARFVETLALVQEAQRLAIAAVRPGVLGRELYHIARDVFAAKGLAERFTHGLGHGIGLDTHEGISLGPSCEKALEPGMIVTIEPGLYDIAWGGIRWEHMVLVTEKSYEIL